MKWSRRPPKLLLLTLSVAGIAACLPVSAAHARAGSMRATHRLSYKTNSSHGCSRSYAITRHSGSLVLRIGRHRATLTLDDVKYYQFGPSRGAYRLRRTRRRAQGRRTTTRRTRRQFSWGGPIKRRSGGGLSIRLTPNKTTCTALPAYGLKGGRGYKCRNTPSLHLLCKTAAVKAYPPVAKGARPSHVGKNEKSRAVRALRCTATAVPSLLRHARYQGAFVFARKKRLSLYSQTGGWVGRNTMAHLRR